MLPPGYLSNSAARRQFAAVLNVAANNTTHRGDPPSGSASWPKKSFLDFSGTSLYRTAGCEKQSFSSACWLTRTDPTTIRASSNHAAKRAMRPEEITELDVFLSLCHQLESESAERYADLADVMEIHNDQETADLFRQLSRYSSLHADSILSRARVGALPAVRDWDFEWDVPEGPETTEFDRVAYLMTPSAVLDLALHNERRGRDFYAAVSDRSPSAEIRRAAAEFAAEEAEHVALIEKWIGSGNVPDAVRDDPDPPNAPE